MQSASDECEFVYIIQIPIKVEIFPQKQKIKFHVVQVGRTTGADAMKERMYAHNFAWHSATCQREAFWKSKAQASDYTVASIHQFPLIIGVLKCPESEGERYGSVNSREEHVRDLVGIKLSEELVEKLLTQEFVSDRAGTAILTNDSKSKFSITELRLVSAIELKGIRDWFQSKWQTNTSVNLSEFDNCAAQWSKDLRTDLRIRLSCTYTDQTPTSQDKGNRLTVKTDIVAHSMNLATPRVDTASVGIANAAAPARQRPSSAGGASKETAAASPRPRTSATALRTISPTSKEAKKSVTWQTTPSSKTKAANNSAARQPSQSKKTAQKSEAKATPQAEKEAKTPRAKTTKSTVNQTKKSHAKPSSESKGRGKGRK